MVVVIICMAITMVLAATMAENITVITMLIMNTEDLAHYVRS